MDRDITNRKDIELLVDKFYKDVLDDDTIGFIFKETVEFMWEKHIPKMYNFWDSILFESSVYKGNPMLKHIILNAKIELSDKRFDRWLELWRQTVEANFRGEIANRAIENATMIAESMKGRIRGKKGF